MSNNFTDFLCEAIKFAKGKDNDYFFHNYAIITFNKGDVSKYKVEGNTAGLWSHACKHLNQIDWPFVQNVVKQVKQTLIQYVKEDNHPRTYEFSMFDRNKKKVEGDPKKLIAKDPYSSIINFLDMINDKVMLKKPLAPIEEKCVKFLEALGDRYGQFIEDVVKKGVDVDQIERDEDKIKALETENYICFNTRNDNSDVYNKIYLDVKDNIMVIKTGPMVNTCYQLGRGGLSRKEFFKHVIENPMHERGFLKPATARAMHEVAGIED